MPVSILFSILFAQLGGISIQQGHIEPHHDLLDFLLNVHGKNS